MTEEDSFVSEAQAVSGGIPKEIITDDSLSAPFDVTKPQELLLQPNDDDDTNHTMSRRTSHLDKFQKFEYLEKDGAAAELVRKVSIGDLNSSMNATKISRVEQSWYTISGNISEVGLRCFLAMFDEYPDIVNLFPFGEESFDSVTGKLKLNNGTKAHVRAHATAVMRVVGTCVAGLTKMEDLIPRLRTVGETHKTVGVQPMHYHILYRHMVKSIREEVGIEHWDQETEDAWEQAFISISEMIRRPSKRLETEPLQGWGIVMLVACSYFMVVTPFLFAGFLNGHANMIFVLNILDFMASFVMFLDLMIYVIQTKMRIGSISDNDDASLASNTTDSKAGRGSRAGLIRSKTRGGRFLHQFMRKLIYKQRRFMVQRLEALRMDRWVPWHGLDVKVLLSFPLQWMHVRSSLCSQIGLHWTQLFGLLRMLCATRVMHFLQCAENNALIEQKLSPERQIHLRIAKLVLKLVLMIHVAACMWCTVARIGLGVEATEIHPNSFFPSPDIISGKESDVLKSYSRAVHWAFVNLSGIGSVDSEPTTTLEVWTILSVHMIGAMFYAVITGNVIAILEEQTKRENEIGADIARLSSYLKTVRVSEVSKDRIMKGYMMRNVLTQASPEGPNSSTGNIGPALDDEILATLPRYLQMEVGIYARAELIHRRDKFFEHCSHGFLVALSSSLSRSRTLLSGDYLMLKGEEYQPEFVLIESGMLQVRQGHDTVKTLNRGDCLGKAWLLMLKNDSQDPDVFSEKTDWLTNSGRAGVSIRALTPCSLLTGLSSTHELLQLERGYKVDFQLLRCQFHGSQKSMIEAKAIAVKVIARCVRKWKFRGQQCDKQKPKNAQ